MTTWLVRGLVMGAAMVLARLAQGTLINMGVGKSSLISILLLVLVWVAAFIWGLLDGRADAKDNPDPDRRRDLAMRWLLAGMAAGVISGLVTWILSLVNNDLYVSGLVGELTSVAAFTALAVFIPAIIAVSVGRLLVDRKNPYQGRRRVSDGDVFEAVREDDDFVNSVRQDWRTEDADGPPHAAGAAVADYPEGKVSPVTVAERQEALEEVEAETEQIVGQIREQADRIGAEIDDIGGGKKP